MGTLHFTEQMIDRSTFGAIADLIMEHVEVRKKKEKEEDEPVLGLSALKNL